MCDQAATTREHIPPRCLFPEKKDASGVDYRKGLLTVPSCDDHNCGKSADDEYLMMVMTGYFQNNAVAQKQIQSKITRAWVRAPTVPKSIVKNPAVVRYAGAEYLAFEVEKRFDRSLSWIANGLHFLETGKQASPLYKVMAYPLFQHSHEHARDVNEGRIKILLMADQLFAGRPKTGQNPDVFWYQIVTDPDGVSTTIRMCFFGAFVVVARSSVGLE
jgi:hypothetical protein